MIEEDQLGLLRQYFDLMNMNGASHCYRASLETGLIDALRDGRSDIEAICERCGLTERPTGLLLEVLDALGVVERDGSTASLTALGQFLSSGEYRNLGDQYWAHLPMLLRSGEPITRMDDPVESERAYQAQAAALSWMLARAAEEAAIALEIGHARVNLRILDVGAGSAVWSLAMARRDPQATITALDWPGVLQVADQSAQAAGLAERFSIIPGNYHDVDLPVARFDLAVLGNVTHLETSEGNMALFSRLRDTLKPGGELVILDVFPGQPEGDLNRTLYALGLAVRTGHGQVHDASELSTMLEASGFAPTPVVLFRSPPFVLGMLVSWRSGTCR